MTCGWLLIRWWIIFQVTLDAGAWALSAFRILDLRGYALLALPWLAWSILEYRRSGLNAQDFRCGFQKLLRRMRKPLPLTIAVIWTLSLVGGAIWPSTYVDSLAYRLPRALHWLSEKGWTWIPSDDTRINVVGLNLELTWLPFLLLFKSDRPLFLLNLISFTFLPGLFYSFLREVGVRGRTAWFWMWILPGGYVFAMQAASLGGDGYSAVVALAAITLALRSRRSRDVWDAWHSILAAAFMTGIKQVTIPLGLVWLPAIFPSIPLLLRRPIRSSAIIATALLVSFVPLAIFNAKYTGSWKGFSKEDLATWEQDSAFWGIVGGVFSVSVQNLAPPIFPLAGRWNDLMARFTTTSEVGRHFKYDLGPALLQQAFAEHTAPLGVGIVLLTLITITAARAERNKSPTYRTDWSLKAIRWLPFIAVLVFLAKSSVSFNGRYIAPYYPFFFPIALAIPGVAAVARKRWWRHTAVLINLVTIGLLLISRQRPMWPVFAATKWLEERPGNVRIKSVCDTFRLIHTTRAISFPQIQASIPPSEKAVGYAIGRQAYLELPLWLPLGSRKVVRVNLADTPETVRQRGLRYILVDPSLLARMEGSRFVSESIEDWMARFHASEVAHFDANLIHQNKDWNAYLVRLD